MSNMDMLIRRIVRAPDGAVKFDSGYEPSHSFLLQFLSLLGGYWGGFNASTDVTNTSRACTNGGYMANTSYWFNFNATEHTQTHGIVVGINTGVTAESNTNYKLDTIINHGVTSGTLHYGGQQFVIPQVVGSNVDMILSRDFYNQSGGSITVKEVGMYVLAGYSFCIVRDVVSDTPVANADTLTVQYTLRTTV